MKLKILPRIEEITKLARELHRREHDEDEMTECLVSWHTDAWFLFVAEVIWNQDREGR